MRARRRDRSAANLASHCSFQLSISSGANPRSSRAAYIVRTLSQAPSGPSDRDRARAPRNTLAARIASVFESRDPIYGLPQSHRNWPTAEMKRRQAGYGRTCRAKAAHWEFRCRKRCWTLAKVCRGPSDSVCVYPFRKKTRDDANETLNNAKNNAKITRKLTRRSCHGMEWQTYPRWVTYTVPCGCSISTDGLIASTGTCQIRIRVTETLNNANSRKNCVPPAEGGAKLRRLSPETSFRAEFSGEPLDLQSTFLSFRLTVPAPNSYENSQLGRNCFLTGECGDGTKRLLVALDHQQAQSAKMGLQKYIASVPHEALAKRRHH